MTRAKVSGEAVWVGDVKLPGMLHARAIHPATLGSKLEFLGVSLDAKSLNSWFGAALVMLTGLGLFEVTRRQFLHEWGEIQEYIEKEIKRREAM